MNIISLVLGLGVLAFGIYQVIKSIRLSKQGIKMEAEIVDVRKKESTSTDEDGYTTSHTAYYPVFKYIYKDQEYTKESNVGDGSSRKYQVGGKVKIVFLESKPQDAQVRGMFNLWIMPVIAIVVGIALLIYSFTL